MCIHSGKVLRNYSYRIFRSISRTLYLLEFATCDLYCGCEKRGALPSISRMRVAACSACSSLGATGGSMVTRRCSYTAVDMMPSYFCVIFHPCGRSQKVVWRMCALYISVCDRPKVRVRLTLHVTYTPENTVRVV